MNWILETERSLFDHVAVILAVVKNGRAWFPCFAATETPFWNPAVAGPDSSMCEELASAPARKHQFQKQFQPLFDFNRRRRELGLAAGVALLNTL